MEQLIKHLENIKVAVRLSASIGELSLPLKVNLTTAIDDVIQLAKNLSLNPDVMLTVLSDDEIETEIYQHLNSLPYAGGYPDDWKNTLAAHIGMWLKSKLGNGE